MHILLDQDKPHKSISRIASSPSLSSTLMRFVKSDGFPSLLNNKTLTDLFNCGNVFGVEQKPLFITIFALFD